MADLYVTVETLFTGFVVQPPEHSTLLRASVLAEKTSITNTILRVSNTTDLHITKLKRQSLD